MTKTQLWCLSNTLFQNTIVEIKRKDHYIKEKFFNTFQILNLLDKNLKSKLCYYLILENYQADSFIISEGEDPQKIYFIKEGIVSFLKNGNEIKTSSVGEFFGDKSILTQMNNTLDVKAKTDCVVYSLSVSAMKQVMSKSFREHLFVNYIKYAFYSCNIDIDISFVWEIFPYFQLKNFNQNEIVLGKGYIKNSNIIIIIEGNIKDKHSKKYIPMQKGEILFKDTIFDWSNFSKSPTLILSSDLVASPECLMLICDIKKISLVAKMSLNEYVNKCKLISSFLHVSLFKSLRKEKIEMIASKVSIETYKKNDIIIKEGEDGERFYVIQKGKVDIYIENKYVRTLNENEYFGEKSLIEYDKRTATAIVKSDFVILYSLNKSVFQKIITEENLLNFLKERLILQDESIRIEDLDYIKTFFHDHYSSCYLVQTRDKKIQYTLKKIEKYKIEKAKIWPCLDTEKKILLQIDHPFIAKLIKTLKDERNIYFLMENIEGKLLFDLLSEYGKLPKALYTFYSASMLLCADYLHQQNMIYRDFKPENVVISQKGFIKLLDFSSAKILKEDNTTTTFIGTPQYMSPEVIKGENYSFDSDFWSIGVCLFQLAFGNFPFGVVDDDPLNIYRNILNNDITFPKDSKDKDLTSLVKKMLNKSKVKRITSFNDIKNTPFYSEFNWSNLVDMNCRVPFTPDVIVEKSDLVKRKKLEIFLKEEEETSSLVEWCYENQESHGIFLEWVENF